MSALTRGVRPAGLIKPLEDGVKATMTKTDASQPCRRLSGLFVTVVATLLFAFATASASADPCPNEPFRVGAAAHLTNCRAYEMVTPVEKPAEVLSTSQGFMSGATDDGEHLFFFSVEPVTSDEFVTPASYRSDRTGSGWTTLSLSPRGSSRGLDDLVHFSPDDLSVVLQTPRQIDPVDLDPGITAFGGTMSDLYHVPLAGAPTFLTPNAVDPTSSGGVRKEFRGASRDGSRVFFFIDGKPILPEAAGYPAGTRLLYESLNGQVHLVSVDDDGTPLPSATEMTFGSFYSEFNAFSQDGRTVFFTTGPEPGEGLFARSDGHTQPIPSSDDNFASIFLGATPDGTKAYFATPLPLTGDDEDEAFDLYEYDVPAETYRRLSAGAAPAAVETNPVWASDDGSVVYFTAQGALVPGRGSAGQDKTFVLDHGNLKFVADARLIEHDTTGVGISARCSPTRITPDGRYLLAATSAALTPDDTDGGAVDVYRYDLETESTVRISTGPTDTNSAAGAYIQPRDRLTGGHQQLCAALMDHLTHPMSDDGRFVFFQTVARLTPDDVNGAVDVYEWDAQTGKTSLVSGGRDTEDDSFLDATPSGGSVFFTSRAHLVSQDVDAALDIYAARIGGGFPEPPPPGRPCDGSGCQGAATSPPTFLSPASGAYRGSGENRWKRHGKRRCDKSRRVRRNAKGRCVKKHSANQRDNANGRTGR
jgi:hypothetical protein